MIRFRLPLSAFLLLATLAAPVSLAQDADPGSGSTDPAAVEPTQDTQETAGKTSTHARRGEVLEEMRADEIKHRERLATIARLAALADEQGDARRLALLDKLEVKEYARYHRLSQNRQTQIDQKTFQNAELALGKGRIRAAVARDLAERANRKAPEKRLRELRVRLGIAPDDPRIKTAQEPAEGKSRGGDAAPREQDAADAPPDDAPRERRR